MYKNIVLSERPQMTTWRMRILCWMPKATETHSEYVFLIALPLQQLLHEGVSMFMFKHMYMIWLVLNTIKNYAV